MKMIFWILLTAFIAGIGSMAIFLYFTNLIGVVLSCIWGPITGFVIVPALYEKYHGKPFGL